MPYPTTIPHLETPVNGNHDPGPINCECLTWAHTHGPFPPDEGHHPACEHRESLGYIMTRGHSSTWMYLGDNPKNIAEALAAELQANIENDDYEPIHIEPRIVTKYQEGNMNDFQGW